LPAYGGAASVGQSLIQNMNHDFVVLSSASHVNSSSAGISGIRQIIFKNYGVGAANTLLYYIKCMFYVMVRKYDVVHIHHAESGFITPIIKLRHRTVITFHGTFRRQDPKFSKLTNKFFRFFERLNANYGDKVISVSLSDQQYINKKYKKNIMYIPNGVDNLSAFYKNPKFLEPIKIFFSAARIYEIKGLHLLLDALKDVKLRFSLDVVGDLNQTKSYKRNIVEKSIGMDVTYHGLIKDKLKLYEMISNSNFFVFPSIQEAMSMMLLEVASIGVPLIVSDIQENKDVFSDNEVLFFKSDDELDLKNKIIFALSYPDVMLKKSTAAKIKVDNTYNWSVISDRYSEIYNDLVGRK